MENIHQISFLNAKEGEKMPYRLSNSKANLQLNHARSTVHSKLRGNIKCWNLQQIQSTQRLYQRKRKLPKTTRKRKTFPPTLQTLFLIFTRRMNSNYSYYEEERNPQEWKRWRKMLPNLETTTYFIQAFIPLLPKTGIINITTHLLSDWSLL